MDSRKAERMAANRRKITRELERLIQAKDLSGRAIIIGGGFAGLAAGVALAERGLPVTLLERRGFLGGRAYSFIDQTTGDVVDNGQHLFMACYENTIDFLRKINRLDRLKFQTRPRVDFIDTTATVTAFDCPPLPAPFHALTGLMKMRGLTLGDKLRAIRVGRALGRARNGWSGATVSKWLTSLGQSENIKTRFWYPMSIATLNENPEIASAAMLKQVLDIAFQGSATSTAIGISRVGLSDLYTDGAREFIEARGGQIQVDAEVAQILIRQEQGRREVAGVELKNGEILDASCIISAVPPQAFLRFLPEDLRNEEFAPIASLRSSPIVSINLWFDRPVTDIEFAGLIGTNIQWLFNKNAICTGSNPANQIAIVISAAHDYVDCTKEELVDMALDELRELIPAARNANLLRSRIIKEREATLSHTVESDSIRPSAQTSISNLILAGDWTRTGLPATIESAVLSGNIAADLAALSMA